MHGCNQTFKTGEGEGEGGSIQEGQKFQQEGLNLHRDLYSTLQMPVNMGKGGLGF